MKGLLVPLSVNWCSVHSFNLFYNSNSALKSQLLLPTPMLLLSTYVVSSKAAKKKISALCRLDPLPWPLPRVCTCHFLLALLCANCLMMWLSIYYWSLDLLLPLFTCLHRLPPAKRRAIHLPKTDSQLPPWMFCSIRPRFPCSFSSGLSSVWDTAGPGKLGKCPWACISRWQIVNSRRRWWFLKINCKEMTCLPCGRILARLLRGLVKCECCLWGGETVKLVPNSMNQIG